MPRPLAVLLLIVFAGGCGQPQALVSGTVTYQGNKVEHGFITFFPLDGAGTTRGGEIADGAFKVAGVPAGKNRVLVTVPPRLAVEKTAKGEAVKVLPAATAIPANARGNNQTVEVAPGEQTLNVELHKS